MRAWVTSEQYHESMEDGGSYREAKAAGGEAEATDLELQRRISKHGRSERRQWRNGESKAVVLVCRNMKGKAAIYRAERGEKANHSPRFTCPLLHITSPSSEDARYLWPCP